MKDIPPVALTFGRGEYIQLLAKVVGSAFSVNSAITRCIYLQSEKLPNSTFISEDSIAQGIVKRATRRVETGGAEIVEAGNWAAAALWFPPGMKEAPPARDGSVAPIILEYADTFNAMKQRVMGDQKYWYLNLIGRHRDRSDPGVVSAIMNALLDRARADGLPVWLESISEHARDVYIHFGFRVVEEVSLGIGSVDAQGNVVDGGEGIKLWAMIAEPAVS